MNNSSYRTVVLSYSVSESFVTQPQLTGTPGHVRQHLAGSRLKMRPEDGNLHCPCILCPSDTAMEWQWPLIISLGLRVNLKDLLSMPSRLACLQWWRELYNLRKMGRGSHLPRVISYPHLDLALVSIPLGLSFLCRMGLNTHVLEKSLRTKLELGLTGRHNGLGCKLRGLSPSVYTLELSPARYTFMPHLL